MQLQSSEFEEEKLVLEEELAPAESQATLKFDTPMPTCSTPLAELKVPEHIKIQAVAMPRQRQRPRRKPRSDKDVIGAAYRQRFDRVLDSIETHIESLGLTRDVSSSPASSTNDGDTDVALFSTSSK